MQIDYKRDLNHNYMIIREEGEPDAASYQIRMLQTNSITGIPFAALTILLVFVAIKL